MKNNSKTESDWIPCRERIPKNNQKVITCTRKGHIDIRIFRIETVHLDDDFGENIRKMKRILRTTASMKTWLQNVSMKDAWSGQMQQ